MLMQLEYFCFDGLYRKRFFPAIFFTSNAGWLVCDWRLTILDDISQLLIAHEFLEKGIF